MKRRGCIDCCANDQRRYNCTAGHHGTETIPYAGPNFLNASSPDASVVVTFT